MTIILSTAVHRENPALAAWLLGTGLDCVTQDVSGRGGRDETRILHISEIGFASHRDVLVALVEGEPELVRAANGMPARIRFGFSDMAFGHALVAELVRPALRPACGEPASARLLGLAERVARSDATVLVLGETGTGKEGVSRYIHACSPRADRDFIAVNCAALPETMLEAILFGHQKGSFTGAAAASEGLFRAADGGTLLLDEIAEMPLALQAKLLRAIQEREVLPVGATRPVPIDVRIIAAANRDLEAEVAAGRFRADLYWRLNVLPLNLEPLARRRLDVRAIAASLLVRHAGAGAFAWPTAAALDRLMAHGWPGNVRELENVLQRALLLRGGERLDVADLGMPAPARQPEPILLPAVPIVSPARLADVSRRVQAEAIAEALARTGGHRLRTAALLGISERTLRYRLADLKVELGVAA